MNHKMRVLVVSSLLLASGGSSEEKAFYAMQKEEQINREGDMHRVEYCLVQGKAIKPYIDDMIRLRLTVFRESPYLYEGIEEEERAYMNQCLLSENTVFIVAQSGSHVVGILSAMPLQERSDYSRPFIKKNIPIENVFCLGELVIEQGHRSEELARALYQRLENHVLSLKQYDTLIECVVSHPQVGEGKSILSDIGGYQNSDLVDYCFWKEVGQDHEVPHLMRYWIKQLHRVRI